MRNPIFEVENDACQAEGKLERAELMAIMLMEEYFEQPYDEVLLRYEYNRICTMVNIVFDYIHTAKEDIAKIIEEVNKKSVEKENI